MGWRPLGDSLGVTLRRNLDCHRRSPTAADRGCQNGWCEGSLSQVKARLPSKSDRNSYQRRNSFPPRECCGLTFSWPCAKPASLDHATRPSTLPARRLRPRQNCAVAVANDTGIARGRPVAGNGLGRERACCQGNLPKRLKSNFEDTGLFRVS